MNAPQPSLKPGTTMLLVSIGVGMLAFSGMLLFGPTPPTPTYTVLTGPEARGQVRNAINDLVRRGNDHDAIDGLLDHLKADPAFAWGWRVVYQLASRDESFAEQRQLAAARLLEMTQAELDDEYWDWDGRNHGIALQIAGKPEQASQAFADSIERVKAHPQLTDGIRGFLVAAMLSLDGQTDAAIEALEHAILVEEYRGTHWLRRSPDLDPIRDDPRLEELILKANELAGFILYQDNRDNRPDLDDQPPAPQPDAAESPDSSPPTPTTDEDPTDP